MIIWGEDTGVEVYVDFLNLREPEQVAADVEIRETESTQLVDPQAYTHFITADIPDQMGFFSIFSLGQTAYMVGDHEKAIERIEAATSAVASEIIPEGLAFAHFRLGWLHQVASKDLDLATWYDGQAIALFPDGPDKAAAYNNRGNTRSAQGDQDAAIADYDQAIVLSSGNANAYFNRGLVNASLGNEEVAQADILRTMS